MAPIAAFRVDASARIGSGHVMRCLTLADRLAGAGVECLFICRQLEGNAAALIADRGFEVRLLSAHADRAPDDWLGTSEAADLADTLKALADDQPDWMVVDHYGIGVAWEVGFCSSFASCKLLAIDDLANRNHQCDLLLDLSPGRKIEDYNPLVDGDTRLLLGLDYALLRPEFARVRKTRGKPRGSAASPARVLVAFGGGETGPFLKATAQALGLVGEQGIECKTTVLGRSFGLATAFPEGTSFVEQSEDVAGLISASDLMICAGGGTNWERCSLGVPAVVMCVADNQRGNIAAMERNGSALQADDNPPAIASAVSQLLSDPSAYQNMAEASWQICDGQGARRVCEVMLAKSCVLRRCTLDDAEFVHAARYSEGAAQYYKNPAIPAYEDHVRWFEAALGNRDMELLVAGLAGDDVAHVRLDRLGKGEAEISIALAQGARGRGMATAVLLAVVEHCRGKDVFGIAAMIHRDNTASISSFERAGFEPGPAADETMLNYRFDMRKTD